MKLTGQIIRILDNRTVIVNRGKEGGVTGDTIFRILGEPEEIFDEFNKRSLGSVTVVKSRVKSLKVYDKFTIASTQWAQSSVDWSAFLGRPGLDLSSIHKTQIVDEGELLVDPGQVQPWKAQANTPVQVGDVVEAEVTIPASTPQQEESEQLSQESVAETAAHQA